jgi:hypothetical protein
MLVLHRSGQRVLYVASPPAYCLQVWFAPPSLPPFHYRTSVTVFCVTDEQCADDEICEKLCLWTHPKGWFVGCKVLCVKRARDTSLPDVFDKPTKNTRVPVSIERPTTRTTSTTTPSSTRITSANSIDKSKTVRKLKPKSTALKSSNSTDPALRFGSDFQLDTDEYDLLNSAGSGDGPLESRRSQPVSRGSPPSIAPIGLRLQGSSIFTYSM